MRVRVRLRVGIRMRGDVATGVFYEFERVDAQIEHFV